MTEMPSVLSARRPGEFLLRWMRVLSPAALLLGAAGCTASASASGTASAGPTSDECMVDSTVVCSNGAMGWTCTGSAQPEDSETDLVCNTDGIGHFCCDSDSACSYDANVTGCQSGSVGYSCTSGAPSPDSSDDTLVCSVPTSVNSVDEYCCFTNATTAASSTCSEDSTVAGCQPDSAGNPSYGFSCTGSESPDVDYSNITCSASGTSGTNAQGEPATLYCCTYH